MLISPLSVGNTNIVNFSFTTLCYYKLDIEYPGKFHTEATNKMSVMQIDDHLNWKSHIEIMLPKLSATCFAVRRLFHVLNVSGL
jgi:hypothetical protein